MFGVCVCSTEYAVYAANVVYCYVLFFIGAKDPEPAPAAEKSSEDGESKASEDENPSNMAEDIIKQYMHRRPSAGGGQ